MVHLVIDPSVIRRHLFGSWYLLTFIAARARMGKIEIHVPWIAHQEVLTGIKDRVEELTAQSDLVKGLNQIAEVANKPEDVQEFVKRVERVRSDTTRETVGRYEHWLSSARRIFSPKVRLFTFSAYT